MTNRQGRQRERRLAALTTGLAGPGEPRAVLESAVGAAADLLGAHTVAAFVRRSDGQGFEVAAARGLGLWDTGTPFLSMERSIAGRAVASGSVQAVEDAAPERASGVEFPLLAGDVAVGAVLVAPIAAGDGEALGVLEVYAGAPRPWAEDDRMLLQALAATCAVALRGARETERARRDAMRAHALAEIGTALYASENLDAVLGLLVRQACSALQASRAVLLRRAGPDQPVTLSHEYTVTGIAPLAELVDIGAELWPWIDVRPDRPQPLVVDDFRSHPDLGPHLLSIAEDQRPRAAIAAPLFEDGQLVGIIGVQQCGQPRHWETEEITFLQTLATQVGLAFRQRHLFATTREDARRLAGLNYVAEALIGSGSFGVMCDRVLAALEAVLGTPISAIYVYDQDAPADRVLRMVAWHGLSNHTLAALAALPLGAGIAGQAAERRAIAFHDRLTASPSEANATEPIAHLEGIEARAGAPMLVRGRLLGALLVAAREPRPWTETDLSLLQTVANQLATALEAEQLRSAAAVAAAGREADRLKGELLSTVSHELRTPLGAIKGFASGLRYYGDRLDEAERADSLRLIDEASDRLAELIDDLLDLQRLEARRLAMAHEHVDLAKLAALVVAEITPRAPLHSIELIAAPNLPPVPGDARRLRQVLQNLVENAVKYSPGGGPVLVQLAARNTCVELRVEDRGLGIAPDQLTLIFERFYRIDNSLTRTIGGTGLGLSIVKGLVTAHGGTIRAESRGEGQGSTFVVTLSAAQEIDSYGVPR